MTSKELVSNKPLAGPELARIIMDDVARMCSESGFLAGQTAYSRVAYDLRLTLHLDLPQMPTATEGVRSRTQAKDKVTESPQLGALEPTMPLVQPSPDAILSATQLSREIASPNLARVEHSLPIAVEVLGQDGHKREELVDYAPSDVGMQASQFAEPDLSDVTPEMRKELGL